MKDEKKILIIEYEKIVGLELQYQLIKKGYFVHRAKKIIDAEEITTNITPDFIETETVTKKESLFESWIIF
jgi:DNA-binding response OmpR family regulator